MGKMNTSNLVKFVLWIVALLLLIACVHFALDLSAVKVDNELQTKVDIYHHFTVYSTRIDGIVYVVEIDFDDTLPYACDGWIPDDENGHNCVAVGSDGIREILTAYHLTLTYPNVKGE